jgi:hypothetical protein
MLKTRKAPVALAALFGLSIYGVASSSPSPQNKPTIETAKQEPEKDTPKEHPAETFWERTTSDPLDLYTLLLAVFTAALVGVSAIQITFLLRADKTARMSAEAARDGVKVARDEFNVTHRPKLRVRRIKPSPAGAPVRVQYVVVNAGETTAIIKRHDIRLCMPDESGAKEILQNFSLERPQLKGGESRPFLANIDAQYQYNFGSGLANGILKIRGIVEYEDEAGTTRRTGFLRTYDDKLGRFRKSDDPEEEYVD